MDFKSAFWQLDLHPDSRSLTVFHANNKIHDDLIIAVPTMEAHNQALQLVMQAISTSGLTLNPKKCSFGKRESVLGYAYIS